MIFGRAALLLLISTLLWAQSVGLWHSTVHPFAGHSQHTKHLHSNLNSNLDSPNSKFPPIFGLLSAHEEGVDCQLFDQLGHGDALTPLLSASFALIPTRLLLQNSRVDFVLRWHTPFQARAPPLLC